MPAPVPFPPELSPLNQVAVPDLWQQEAVAALRAGRDVVVQAPTGAGKTLIFELWSNQGKNRGQAIYTVPTRALANDKLAEWRARGWNVGIATGDLAENLDAPILVATLETQKNRLIRGEGPALLVIDEYQMIRDPDRGLNYELSIALAPAQTQLLLLSGSVANPQDIVKWLRRLGRDALLVRHDLRPVPQEEVYAGNLSYHVPSQIQGYWPRLIAKALAEDLGPILIFAPRRQAAESMAADLARQLPTPVPLQLTPAQKLIVGDHLARQLKSRIAYHHSGLSYAVRAGVIEPLAKAGQLRVVVATMGLAAGINFSLRSVALAADSYRRNAVEEPLRPDELLQMFGRAGRRGLDETGYVLITANELRLLDARPAQLARSAAVDWGALLNVMCLAALQDRDPFREAVRVQDRLFTTRPIVLGVEESLRHPDVPCGLKTDAERARHVRKLVREMRNSQGEWEPLPASAEKPLHSISIVSFTPAAANGDPDQIQLRPAVSESAAAEKTGSGALTILRQTDNGPVYGRSMTVADVLADGRIVLAKWIRRLTQWNARQVTREVWDANLRPLIDRKLAQQNTPVAEYVREQHRIVARLEIGNLPLRVPVDCHGVALFKPPTRDVLPPDCARCSLVPVCRTLSTASGTALTWRRLNLVDAKGNPTQRGQLVSFFTQGDGLAIAAALEDTNYPLDELIYDIANLSAGFRFCGDDNRWGGRLAVACHEQFGLQSIPGYLENGVPPGYGAGANLVVASIHKNPQSKHQWISDLVGVGDIDRLIIEWRSLLRQVGHARDLDWPRWRAFQAMAKTFLAQTESPTVTEFPPLDFTQTRRVDHRLVLRRN
ncbi:MAG: DEAD/DEAH box helicase [Verrucomicrobiota bacterium]